MKGRLGETVELVVRVVDAREIRTGNGLKYFFLFEDETGIVEGVGGTACFASGSPPACCLRGEVRADSTGRPRVVECAFLKSF